MVRFASVLLLAATSLVACGGGGEDYETGTCLTDAQICSLSLGVTTKDEALKRFGTPSTNSAGTGTNPSASYTCVRLDGSVEAYSQSVFLWFDENAVLDDVDVTRGGRDAAPVPACVAELKKQ